MTGALRRVIANCRWELVAIVGVAFAARAGFRLVQGEAAFLNLGYTFYVDLAQSFLQGQGFCFDAGTDCALRVPLYPLLVSAFIHWDWLYPGVPILQAALSASCCLIAYGIAGTLFDRRAGLIAAGLTAVNPYAIAHSTTLQDTTLFNLLMGLAVYLLIRWRGAPGGLPFKLAAGVTLGLAALTSVRLVLFVPFCILWVAWPAQRGGTWRIRQAALVSVPILALVGGWTVRNWSVTGVPVLTTEFGTSLWLANHPVTTDFLPERSIDEVYDAAYAHLPEQRKVMLAAMGSELPIDRLLGQWAIEHIRENPGQTLVNMVRKVGWAFSGQLSPAREPWIQWGYAAYAIPLHVFALLGWWRSRERDQHAHWLIAALFVAFIVTTAVFWAHTSHKSTLHMFLGVYAGFAISQWLPRPAAPAEARA